MGPSAGRRWVSRKRWADGCGYSGSAARHCAWSDPPAPEWGDKERKAGRSLVHVRVLAGLAKLGYILCRRAGGVKHELI